MYLYLLLKTCNYNTYYTTYLSLNNSVKLASLVGIKFNCPPPYKNTKYIT